MKAHGAGCCQRGARRGGWTAGGATFAALAALTPKCPLCAAAWLGVLGLSGLAARVDPRAVWLATALAAAACSALVGHRLSTRQRKETR